MTSKFYNLLIAPSISDVHVPDDASNGTTRTELDSHANMPFVGCHAYIISETGKVADVNPFTPDYKPMQIPIVDAAVQYDCPYTGTSYILVLQNALHVPSMQNKLLPPFIMRGAGVVVSNTAKIQVDDPTTELSQD